MSRTILLRVAAVLGPLLVVAGALWALSLPGPWVPSERVLMIDKAMLVQPDVVVVGNSLVANDIDAARLGALLADPAPGVALLAEPASRAPVYYAMLRYRVFGAGYRPRLVLVVSTLRAMLTTQLVSARDFAQLAAHFAEPDEVLATRTLGGAPWLIRVRERRTKLHDLLLDGIKYGTVGLLFREAGPARSTADDALAEVFEAGALEDVDTSRRAIPIVEIDRTPQEHRLDPSTSYLPDMIRLAEENGARIVLVRAPLSPSHAHEDAVPHALVRETIAFLNARDAGWLDLTDIPFSEREFIDALHMNAEGRQRFTDALAERLRGIGAWEDRDLTPARLPTLPSRHMRTGVPPVIEARTVEPAKPPCGKAFNLPEWRFLDEAAVADAGFGPLGPLVVLEDGVPLRRRIRAVDLAECTGVYAHAGNRIRFSPTRADRTATWTVSVDPDLPSELKGFPPVWWVYPGTTLRFELDAPWDPVGGPFQVRVQVAAFGTSKATADVVVAGLRAPLEPDPSLSGDPLAAADRVAVIRGPAPDSAWSLEIRSPPDGPWLAVRRLSFGEGEAEDAFIGHEAPGTLSLLAGPSRFSDNPVPRVETPPLAVEDGVGVFRVPDLLALCDTHLQRESQAGSCSPFLVLEDGAATITPHASPATVASSPGRSSHHGREIRFRPADGTDPSRNGRTYTLVWDPSRTCSKRRWLLPGDVLVAPARWMETRLQRRPYQGLVLGAVAVRPNEAGGRLHVTVHGGGRSWLETDIPFQDLTFGTSWPLDEPMGRATKDIEVVLRSPEGSPPVVVSKILLTEDAAAGTGTEDVSQQ